MSKPRARTSRLSVGGYQISIARCALALGLIVLGIVWIYVYTHGPIDVATWTKSSGAKKPHTSLGWMADLKWWNFVIGFGLIFLGLTLAADRGTPLGHGTGVVVGMLGCFLLGLIWIVVYYFAASDLKIPLLRDLGQYNLLVGVGFMAVGFTYATKWE